MRPNGTSKQLAKRRQPAFELLERGQSVKAVAAKLKVSERSIRRWRQEKRQPKKTSARSPGRMPYLTDR